MTISGKTILLISPEGWGQNFVSKHHYAAYLAKHCTVYFLNPVSASNKTILGSVHGEIKPISKNLFTVSYQNIIPKLNAFPKFIQSIIYKKQAKQIQKLIGLKEIDIVWSFDPFRFFNQKVWNASKYVYHTVDVHFNKCFETDIAKSSDLVLLSSELLRAKLEPFQKNIQYTGHATDLDNFEDPNCNPVDLPGENKIKAGLVGNFNSNVDYNLIKTIAEENKNIDFIFVGPYQNNNLGMDTHLIEDKVNDLKILKNVFFIGSKPSREIISWLKSFDINLVLYRSDKRDIIINPHKMMGYFYAGKITVCSWFNEYKDVNQTFLYMTNNNHEIPEIIAQIGSDLNYWNDKKLTAKRRNFAINNSYDKKIEAISSLLYNINQ